MPRSSGNKVAPHRLLILGVAVLSLLDAVFLTGCVILPETRDLATVSVARTNPAPALDYPRIGTLLDGLAQQLYANGFTSNWGHTPDGHPAHPYDHISPWVGGREYSASFMMGTSQVRCVARFKRTKAEVVFYEWAVPPRGAHLFSPTDAERQKARSVAVTVQNYLRGSLPPAYQVDISFKPLEDSSNRSPAGR